MNLATQLTLLRILLVPVLIGLFFYAQEAPQLLRPFALFVFVVACVTDALDGWIARRFRQWTQLGTLLDPLSDKMLLNSTYICLTIFRYPDVYQIPPWLTLLVVFRDVVIVGGWVLIYFFQKKIEVAPFFVGKLTTLLQMMLVVVVLMFEWSGWMEGLLWIVTVSTVLSGVVYIHAGMQRLQNTDSKDSVRSKETSI